MRLSPYRKTERGVTSLIVVLFTTLLFVVVVVGFMQTMTVEQRASANDELSRGAYDSALAGVEDGKRVLQACLIDKIQSACDAITQGQTDCQTIKDAGYVSVNAQGEVLLRSNSSSGLTGQEYQQAYTCVKISPATKDYIGKAAADQSVVIPLRTTAPMNKIVISWFKNINSTTTNGSVNLDPVGNLQVSLPAKSVWPPDMPSVMRVQLIQFEDGKLNLDDFDKDGGGHTLYLYPKQLNSVTNFGNDFRRIGDLSPSRVACATTFITTYACEATIDLPTLVGGSTNNRVAYLRITSLYNAADFSVRPADGAIKFDKLQPSIDSTGRAADVFRRVEARIEFSDPNDAMLYPRATVDTTSSFCKAFTITDDPADFTASCS
ncbi:MAG: hypothetical protein ABIP74_00880 [Candidatus Saccharimonas sp.]